MTQSPQLNLAPKNKFIFILGLWLGIILFSIVVAGVFTNQSLVLLKESKVKEAARAAKFGRASTLALRAATLNLIPDIALWDSGLQLISKSDKTVETVSYITAPIIGQAIETQSSQSPVAVETRLLKLNALLQDILSLYKKSWLVQRYITLPNWLTSLPTTHSEQVITSLSTGHHSYLILFQNTHELRPTGGFPGSFAKLTIDNGQITEFLIDDIYQPDGQFTGYREAPPGVKEYLSSGKGWRLPDANWSPDFPTSAQNVMSYFALGQQQDITGVIAINLSLVERLLEITGPLYVPDFSLEVTQDNFAEVARMQREEFFPGSQQKANLLRSLSTAFKQRLTTLNTAQWLAITETIAKDAQRKELQLYSLNPSIQALSESLNLDGSVWVPPQSEGFMAIEANAGINKANPWVSRNTHLTINDYTAIVETTWINTAPTTETASVSGYVNYHRYWLPASWQPTQTTLQTNTTQPTAVTDALDNNIITISRDDTQQTWRELGTLVRVPQGTTVTLRTEFTKPSFVDSPPNLTLFSQSGLPPSPFSLTTPSGTNSWVQDSDVTLPLLQ